MVLATSKEHSWQIKDIMLDTLDEGTCNQLQVRNSGQKHEIGNGNNDSEKELEWFIYRIPRNMATVFLHTDEQFPAIQLEISFSFNGIDEAKSYNRIYHEIWVSPLEFILVLYTKEGEENFSEILTLSRE